MKRYFTLLILLICGLALRADDATVRSFEAEALDVSAQRYSRTDRLGNLCALIKINVMADSVTCSGSVIGDVARHNLNEFWLYVPADAKMVKIAADTFLPIMYVYPQALQGGVTYVMKIDVPHGGPAKPQLVQQAYLLMKVSPENAYLTIGNDEYPSKNGVIKVLLKNGTYDYRVSSGGFYPEEGRVTINGQTVNQMVTLRSSKPVLSVRATTPGTQIYVNGEMRGTGSAEIETMTGLSEIEGRLAGHRSHTQTVDLATGQRREVVIPALEAIYGALNIDYEPVGATVTVDGRAAGTTPLVLNNLLAGDHTVVISAPDHETATLSTTIADSQTATLSGSLSKDDKPLESFSRNGKWGYKRDGVEVIAPKYDFAWPFSEGLAYVSLNGKLGFIDKTGREVIPFKYDDASFFSEGLAAVWLNDKWGFIDKTGREVIPLKYDDAESFSEGLATVGTNGKYGFIDKNGHEVIPLKYDYAWDFSEGLAMVKLNGKEGFIDKTGRVVIPFKYDRAWSFYNGKANVLLNGEEFYIDKTGNRVK